MKFIVMMFRMVLTAYCFAQLAFHALWLSKWVIPRLMKGEGTMTEKRSRTLFHAHRHITVYLNTLSRLKLVSFDFVGNPVKEPAVLVANHPSLLDFIVLLRDFSNLVCLYKPQTRNNPILSDFVRLAGYIKGMDGTREASKRIVDECCQRLHEGHHVAFFPEGTRSKSNHSVSRFRTTGFHAAIKAGVAVQPVVIYCEPLFLGKHQPWSEFSKSCNRMIIEYLPPIKIEEMPEEQRNAKGMAESARKLIKSRLLELDKNRA